MFQYARALKTDLQRAVFEKNKLQQLRASDRVEWECVFVTSNFLYSSITLSTVLIQPPDRRKLANAREEAQQIAIEASTREKEFSEEVQQRAGEEEVRRRVGIDYFAWHPLHFLWYFHS